MAIRLEYDWQIVAWEVITYSIPVLISEVPTT